MCDWVCDMINWIKMIDWNTCLSSGFGAFFGALGVLLLSIHLNDKKQNAEDKEELTKYFYNLNTALRNIGILSHDLVTVISTYEKEHKFLFLPTSNIQFNFNEAKLGFVQKNSNIFFENINQLKIEMNGLNELGIYYKNNCDSDINIDLKANILYQILKSTVIIVNQITLTMKNINDYIKIYYKEELVSQEFTENFEKVEKYTNDFKNLIKNNPKYPVEVFEAQIKAIREGWQIKFESPKSWYERSKDKKGK